MRLEPHSHVCPDCGGLLIIARNNGNGLVTLDATPATDGDYRAYLNARGDAWLANPYTPTRAWLGTRRRLHECVVPDLQLELGTEAPPDEPILPPNKELATCQPADSTRRVASSPSQRSSP